MNRSATTREEILRIAREIAQEEGVDKLNIRRMAKENHIAVGTIYNYYPSKTDLMLALAEDFWKTVFHGGITDLKESACLSDACGELYGRLYEKFSRFRRDFIREIRGLGSEGQRKGREMEQKYMRHMENGLLLIMERDPLIRPGVWEKAFTKEEFAGFLLSNMLLLLGRGEKDCRFLKECVRRLLYGRYEGGKSGGEEA